MQAIYRTISFINNHPLAQKNLILAYYRFFKWQFNSIINKNLQPVHFIGSINFLAKKRLTGITGNIYTGLHEFNDMGFLLHFLKQDDLFFDIGANVGSYTLLASFRKAKTIAFEPILETFDILKKNIELNSLHADVTLVNKAVSSKHGIINFTNNQDTTNHVVNHASEQTTEVEMILLDDFFEENKPILMKIDVEGFETEVLNGAKNYLSDTSLKAIIIELNGSGNRYGFKDDDIQTKLLKHHFKPYDYNPITRILNELSTYGKDNTIYIRDLEFVKKRIQSSEAFKILNQVI
ncbi:FkbM family methyltransferase [Pedobacter psychrotolerans]|uniref:FkbM family methyltransferase n=1 Tax=Pedobacter psychrotolerans TaxID=1843235 RepID=UPI003F9B8C0F